MPRSTPTTPARDGSGGGLVNPVGRPLPPISTPGPAAAPELLPATPGGSQIPSYRPDMALKDAINAVVRKHKRRTGTRKLKAAKGKTAVSGGNGVALAPTSIAT